MKIEIINLDISNKRKTTDLAIRTQPPQEILFRVYDDDYIIDYSKFIDIRLTLNSYTNNSTNTYTLNTSRVVEINNEKFISWIIPNNIISNVDKYSVEARVRITGKTTTLNPFKLLIYITSEPELNAIMQAIRNFNELTNEYLKTLKRTEFGIANGIIQLDSEGKIDKKYLKENLDEHIVDTLYDTMSDLDQIHGLRINKDNYDLEYYDEDDKRWYMVNSIYGGDFTLENKPSEYDIFGGNFTDPEPDPSTDIFGGNFTD